MRLLVVEDDEKIASFIVNGLEQNGYSVDKASDGEQALSFCRTVAFDAIILDIMLPKLDGLAVIRAIRQAKSLTPVLLLSAKASVDNRVTGLQAGADDYLTKPLPHRAQDHPRTRAGPRPAHLLSHPPLHHCQPRTGAGT